jgi:hypothetical protein
MSDQPTSFHDFKWACGHTGPSYCKICRDNQVAKATVQAERDRRRIEELETVLKKCGQHTEACACRDLSDRGTSFPRHDWPCDCGLRVALERGKYL